MPFNWKKNKTTRNRFSQLVADHLQSPSHGGSLVVETGFPTSIIDIYVRNRGRFRKLSAKKPNQSPLTSASGSFVNLINSSLSDSVVDIRNSSSGDSEIRAIDDVIMEQDVVIVDDDDEIKIEDYRKTEGKLNPVIVVMLKVLLMAVLVFGSKRFTIGITLSAFVLCIVESVGKRLKSPIIIRSSKQAATVVVCSQVLEIEEQLELKQEESDEVLIEIVCKSSRKALMRSRIKKLVPKKLRRSSMDSKLEICEEKTMKPLVCLNECSVSNGETICILRRNEDKLSVLGSETECDGEESGAGLEWNCGCLILFLIVLVGLIGGRVLALVMALSWCLMLKLQSRNVKFLIS